MAKLIATPGQTVGPFFGYALPYAGGEDLVDRSHPAAVRLHGTVFDGNGNPVPDALVELWQADESGRIPAEPGSLKRDGYTFTGFGRAAVDDAGHYQFVTVIPGATGEGIRPFFMITVFARGLLDKLHTRAYLPGVDVAGDAVLSALDTERAETLITKQDAEGSLLFDIRLQGAGETVFFDFGA